MIMTDTQTLTRAKLAEAVYEKIGLSRNESAELVESVLDEVVGALMRDEKVKISGFGTFTVRQKGQRVGRNPKTGEEVPIHPRKVVVFKPSNIMKDKVAGTTGSAPAKTSMASENEPSAPSAAPQPNLGFDDQ